MLVKSSARTLQHPADNSNGKPQASGSRLSATTQPPEAKTELTASQRDADNP
jgi:hypothetical protein